MLAGGAQRGSRDSERAPAGPKGRGAGVGRPGDTALCSALSARNAPLLGSLPLRPSVGASRLSLRAALCALRWAPRSLHSFPPPAQSSFKSAPALAASELINMQNHLVTH